MKRFMISLAAVALLVMSAVSFADTTTAPATPDVPAISSANVTTKVDTGDTAMQGADKAPQIDGKVGLLKEAIDKYRNALIKDPFSVEATLKLAIAYDRVMRKGCAIAMLKRLAALSNNPKFAPEANRNIDAIDANGQWFKGYRKDAMSAVGR